MTLATKKQCLLFVIFTTTLIDWFAFALVFPFLAPLFLDVDNGVLPPSCPYRFRQILLGALLTTYSIVQFFAAPLLGALSDRIGRKKILLLAFSGNFLGYIFSGIGVSSKQVFFLFLGHFVAGLTGANIAVTNSAVADISSKETKARNFGIISMALAIAFIVGPYLGSLLSRLPSAQNMQYALLFFLSAGLTLLNILVLLFFFKESLQQKRQTPLQLFGGLKNIQQAFRSPDINRLYLVIFLLAFGWTCYSKLFPAYLIERFHLTQEQIGFFFSYFGIWSVVTQSIVLQFVSRWLSPVIILKIATLLLALSLPLLLLPQNMQQIYYLLPFVAISQGLIQPNSTAIVSNAVHSDVQGETLGIVQSVQSLSKSIAPLVAGIFAAFHPTLPTLCGSFFLLLAWVLFHRYPK